MGGPEKGNGSLNIPDELRKRKRIISGELRERTLWFIKLRWLVPPSIAVGTLLARSLGVELNADVLLGLAVVIFLYNLVFYLMGRGLKREPEQQYVQRFTYWQVGFDYGTMFLLIHFTGGAASPFLFFFIFHITFSAIFLPRRSTLFLAAAAVFGMLGIAVAEHAGWISHHGLLFHQAALDLGTHPFHLFVMLSFFAGFIFITAFSITAVMKMVQRRILDLAEITEAVTALNKKLRTLHALTQAIGSKQHLNQVLQIATAELAKVMEVEAISVKLLSEDGKSLRFAAAHGLPSDLMTKVLDLEKSSLNRRVIEGDTFVTGRVTRREYFQFGEDLSAIGLQSVQFVPLTVENRVIGILGAYSIRSEQFGPEDLDFFRQAAGLVAIAIENARAYESIEHLVEDRSRFMNRVAHNLRAPLAAMASMLEVIQDGYVGHVTEGLAEYLVRVDERVRNMLVMINELMTLARSQNRHFQVEHVSVDLNPLLHRIHQMFHDKASRKKLTFQIDVPNGPLEINGNREMLQQLFENLISNSIKYTPEGGEVGITMIPALNDTIRIAVRDTGIGIPRDEFPLLFSEFFRASNVKGTIGTGLGLAIVKEIVDQHGAEIHVESREGSGTTFTLAFPAIEIKSRPQNMS
jgi:signal transduction histidine kinase